VFDEVAAWAQGALARGFRPLVYAYALGKAQEAVKQLSQRGLSLVVHPDIHALNEIYRAHGVELSARCFDGVFHDGEVGVFPPWGRSRELRHLPNKASAVLTGWALDPGIERRYGADRAFPISDHADFPSLLTFAKATGAREVLTHHGYAKELASALRDQGVFARPVDEAHQLALPL
jgi:putative mRNA 3-end processing factor